MADSHIGKWVLTANLHLWIVILHFKDLFFQPRTAVFRRELFLFFGYTYFSLHLFYIAVLINSKMGLVIGNDLISPFKTS